MIHELNDSFVSWNSPTSGGTDWEKSEILLKVLNVFVFELFGVWNGFLGKYRQTLK